VYFLQRSQWQRSVMGRQLRRVCYVAYKSKQPEHEESPGDLAVRSLEQHVHRLEARLAQTGTDTRDLAAEVAPAQDPDHELVEVRHEQEFHLRTFAGREALLEEIAQWIDRTEEGGYLLLLGPPGQGKSALVAELARREGQRHGSLLHMVKSHRNPLKFVPSLISQAAKKARTQFGPDAYRGDVDDLRNALLRAVEALQAKTGKAVLVLDALDELEHGNERITFLPESLPVGVHFILTCRPDIPLVQALRARLQHLEERPLPAFRRKTCPWFCNTGCKQPGWSSPWQGS
jgi:hypothetical protein